MNLTKPVEDNTDNKINVGKILEKPVEDNSDKYNEKLISELKRKIRKKINDIHSKINTNLPFRTDIKAEIRTKAIRTIIINAPTV